jgi:hypothetical protein
VERRVLSGYCVDMGLVHPCHPFLCDSGRHQTTFRSGCLSYLGSVWPLPEAACRLISARFRIGFDFDYGALR